MKVTERTRLILDNSRAITLKLKLRLTLWGKSVSYICNNTIICQCGPSRLSSAVRLAEGLADDHCDRLLAVPRDCPLKIKFVRCGSAENVKSALRGLYAYIYATIR